MRAVDDDSADEIAAEQERLAKTEEEIQLAAEPEEQPLAPAEPRPEPVASSTEQAPVIGVVVVGTDPGDTPEAAIRSAGEGRPVVFVAPSDSSQAAAIARRAGAAVVELDGLSTATGGRARNAGYRQLKTLAPDLGFVQFIPAGSALHPDWLTSAAHFMARRPEVSVIEGATKERYPRPSKFAAFGSGEAFLAGEAQASGPMMLVRVEGFEAAGGFRNDLKTGETEDLCLRLRRRGRHIWRLDAPMAVREIQPSNISGWWSSAVRRGFGFAYSAALHGRAPERFRAPETARAVIWGGLYPAFVFGAAAAAAGAAYLLDRFLNPLMIAALIVALGCSVYATRWFWAAARRGFWRFSSWNYGLYATLRFIPEFFGVLRFWLSSEKPRRSGSRAV